jgi:DNA-binding response OmpR family regulator
MPDRHPCERVLLVDEDIDLREAVREVLADEGCAVEAFSRAEDAFPRVAVFRPHVILLDVGLDGAGAPLFLARLRQDPASASIPVVLLSGSREALRRLRSRAAGVLEKPFGLDTLFETIEELCGTAAA